MRAIADIRKQEILEHFHAVVNDHGFAGASLAKVADSLGVTRSLLLHYFQSKDDLILSFAEYIIEKYEAYYLDPLPSFKTPHERFEYLLDMLLVDYPLDDGDNGLSTMAAMRERYGDIPGVVITADHGDDVRSAARSMGYTVLRKPVKPAALRAIISQYTVRSTEGA